jgi:uncharacterized protein (DUF1697 family)
MFWVMRQVALLRGINLGSRNRVAMPKLRELLATAGYDEVRTYLQSGNVVLSSGARPNRLAKELQELIDESFGLRIAVVVRTRDELAKVVSLNPLGKVATNPKRYQVSFLDAELDQSTIDELAELATGSERFTAVGRELYAWHPDGVARSKLWNKLAAASLGVTATARNWTTVTSLLAMADE